MAEGGVQSWSESHEVQYGNWPQDVDVDFNWPPDVDVDAQIHQWTAVSSDAQIGGGAGGSGGAARGGGATACSCCSRTPCLAEDCKGRELSTGEVRIAAAKMMVKSLQNKRDSNDYKDTLNRYVQYIERWPVKFARCKCVRGRELWRMKTRDGPWGKWYTDVNEKNGMAQNFRTSFEDNEQKLQDTVTAGAAGAETDSSKRPKQLASGHTSTQGGPAHGEDPSSQQSGGGGQEVVARVRPDKVQTVLIN